MTPPSWLPLPLACFLALVGVRATSAQCYRFSSVSSGTAASLTVNITNLPRPTVTSLMGTGRRYFYDLRGLSGNTVSLSLGKATDTRSVFPVNESEQSPKGLFSIYVDSSPLFPTLSIQVASSNYNDAEHKTSNGLAAVIALTARLNPNRPNVLLPNGLPSTLPPLSSWSGAATISASLRTATSFTPLSGTLASIGTCSVSPHRSCKDAVSQLKQIHIPPGDPIDGFIRNQICIAETSCDSQDIKDKDWLNNVVSDFISPFTMQSGRWKQVEDMCRRSPLIMVQSQRLECEEDMADYHISYDLQNALNKNGCGTSADWDLIGGLLTQCVETGVDKDVAEGWVRRISKVVASETVLLERSLVRDRCIQYRSQRGQPLQ